MATWTSITYAFGSLLTSAKMALNQDNFLALAEGASGAPKILTAALNQVAGAQAVTVATVRPGTNNYVLRTNGSGAVEWSPVTINEIGAGTVAQAWLKTTAGTLLHVTGWNLLPGGEYGFVPQVGSNTATNAWSGLAEGSITNTNEIGGASDATYAGAVGWLGGAGTSAYLCYAYLTQAGNSCSGAHVQQRYVSASPPYDYGNGQAHLFVYALVDKNGTPHGVWIAPDPVWAYNGPTWVAPDYYRNGKGYQRRLILPKHLADLENTGPQFEEVEVTQAIKNADMDIVPHPFGTVPDGQRVVLLDPCCELMAKLAEMHDIVTDQNGSADPHGFDYSPPGFLLHNDYIRLDNASFGGRTPRGVQTVAPKWKLTR